MWIFSRVLHRPESLAGDCYLGGFTDHPASCCNALSAIKRAWAWSGEPPGHRLRASMTGKELWENRVGLLEAIPIGRLYQGKKDFANMGFPGLMKPLVEEYESISTS